MASLFSDFLVSLGVKHTEDYSDDRFENMPFQSLFGLANLLKEYGIGSVGVSVDAGSRKDALDAFTTPFLIDTPDGFLIILKKSGQNVSYISDQKVFTVPVTDIIDSWNGVALLVETDSDSIEPEYTRHHIAEIAKSVKYYLLISLAVVLAGSAMWQTHLYSHWAAWLVFVFDCAGIVLSWMLVQKSLGIHNAAAEAVCSVLEEGGCDELARSEASSFMGIFKWSEVGVAYFSVSLLAMLLFPQTIPALAAINILCLPYTIWSITYQKFKAKVWCTLCVSVQATLWLLFVSYLIGGWTKQIFPLSVPFLIDFVVLVCCYGAVLLAINRLDDSLMKYFKTKIKENENA